MRKILPSEEKAPRQEKWRQFPWEHRPFRIVRERMGSGARAKMGWDSGVGEVGALHPGPGKKGLHCVGGFKPMINGQVCLLFIINTSQGF